MVRSSDLSRLSRAQSRGEWMAAWAVRGAKLDVVPHLRDRPLHCHSVTMSDNRRLRLPTPILPAPLLAHLYGEPLRVAAYTLDAAADD